MLNLTLLVFIKLSINLIIMLLTNGSSFDISHTNLDWSFKVLKLVNLEDKSEIKLDLSVLSDGH